MNDVQAAYERVLELFFSGRMPRLNHARHLAIANILNAQPYGRELMHLGLQISAIRAGVPGKYSREVTDSYWDNLDGRLPDITEFADVLNTH